MSQAYRDVVVVGASAGGVEALRALAAGLPPDLPAAIVVVLHLPAGGTSVLPLILDRAGPLPATAARPGMRLRPGRIVVAPPDYHVLISDHTVQLSAGPTENGHRPAIDVLFRSAARVLGPRVTGVVLSGALDDGTAGLVAIAAQGGRTIVQDPAEAQYRGMPESALRHVRADHVLPAGKIGTVLAEFVAEPVELDGAPIPSNLLRLEADIAQHGGSHAEELRSLGESAGMTCPDCGGELIALTDPAPEEALGDPTLRYRCHVGHAWSPTALLAQQSVTAERALWVALRTLQEKGRLSRQLLAELPEEAPMSLRERHRNTIDECEHAAEVLRGVVLSGLPPGSQPDDGS